MFYYGSSISGKLFRVLGAHILFPLGIYTTSATLTKTREIYGHVYVHGEVNAQEGRWMRYA